MDKGNSVSWRWALLMIWVFAGAYLVFTTVLGDNYDKIAPDGSIDTVRVATTECGAIATITDRATIDSLKAVLRSLPRVQGSPNFKKSEVTTSYSICFLKGEKVVDCVSMVSAWDKGWVILHNASLFQGADLLPFVADAQLAACQ